MLLFQYIERCGTCSSKMLESFVGLWGNIMVKEGTSTHTGISWVTYLNSCEHLDAPYTKHY